jgi:ATP-binding cassette subfamily C protein
MHTPAGGKQTAAGPFLIEDPAKVWIVEQGTVDVSLVPTENGEPVGPRLHVMRVEGGQAIFGVVPGAAGMHTALLAVPGAETAIREAALADFRARQLDIAPALLNQWILALARAAIARPFPASCEPLQPGRSVTLKQGQTASPREGVVVWVRGGQELIFPGLEAPLRSGQLFPVSPHAWLEAAADCVVTVHDSESVLGEDTAWEGVQSFHRASLACLLERGQVANKNEAARLQRKQRNDSARLDFALRQLAAVLRGGHARAALEGADEDAWLLACRALEEPLGVRFQPHPDRGRGLEDPAQAIARASGLRVRTVVLSGKWWTWDAGPLLARRERDKRPVALLPASARSYHLYDPADGTSVRVDRAVAESLEPFARCFYRPFPPKHVGLGDVLSFGLWGCRRDLATMIAMALGAGLLALAIPVATGYIFDSLIPGAKRLQLLQAAAFLGVVAVSIGMFHVARSFAMLRLEGRMDASVQAAVWDRLLALPVPFFRDYTAGDLAQRGLGIMRMRQILTGSALASILSGVFSALSFVLLFYYNWKLALLAAALMVFAFCFVTLAGWLQVRCQREMSEVQGRISGLLLQLIGGIAKIRVAGAERRAFGRWSAEYSRQKRMTLRARHVSASVAVFNSAFPVLCSLVVFYYVAVAMRQPGGAMSTGRFLAFLAAFTQFLVAGFDLSTAVVSTLGMVPLYERARPILRALPEVDRAKSYPGELSGHIELRNVSFRYRPDAPLVLKKLSLVAQPGQFVAIVGPSGAGKSTLFRLLLGFEFPEAGSICYDRRDLATLDLQALRQRVGVVLQNGRVRGGTILQNIVGSAPLTLDDAWEAARMTGFAEDIKAMPMGMHTVLAEGGGALSGGQRQRLLVARALVRKPRIVLFDEATSALDNQTQAIVSASLERLQATRVVIAHRLSTIMNADVIHVIENGEVTQRGTYRELSESDGPFARLARRQLA